MFLRFLIIISLFIFLSFQEWPEQSLTYDEYPFYDGSDLGLTYSEDVAQIKVWSPTASEVILRIYDEGINGKPVLEKNMQNDIHGTWYILLEGGRKNKFYTIQSKINDQWMNEVPDPYAIAVGINGKRTAIIDLNETDPANWENDKSPELKNYTDIILYELHIRDISIAKNSGIKNKGKYLGLTEIGTEFHNPVVFDGKVKRIPLQIKTGLDHIKELGVTHVHLLPCYDFSSVDETKLDSPQYNWGYDPQNYNVPEGSYATDPYNPMVRIKEFKQMIHSLHENGLGVIMDVVYNHTSATGESVFNQLVPGYFYRHNSDSGFSNASGCGNEIASERRMVRKFIIESVKYWAAEYHIDGFRFDLMGILDTETMKQIRSELDKIDSTIFIYGEGWTAGNSPYPSENRALKNNMKDLDRIAAFCDDLRDGIKGSWADHTDIGFVSGKPGTEESIKFGVAAATQHQQINYSSVNYSKASWANQPYQCINYTSCHDDLTLWDKLLKSNPEDDEKTRIARYNLANAIVLTSQGVPFLHSGVEFARTKYGDYNSYRSSDSINQIDWERKMKYREVYNYYKALISLRKAHPAFRMSSNKAIQNAISYIDFKEKNIVGFYIKCIDDPWKEILVIYNANSSVYQYSGYHHDDFTKEWTIVANGQLINLNGINKQYGDTISVGALSMMVAYR
jgi:pullulanase